MYRLTLLLLVASLSGCLSEIGDDLGLSEASPDPWVQPDLADATIRPGAALGGGGCTGNFLFLDADGATVYIGTAAHCVSDDASDEATDSNGCDSARYEPAEPGTVGVNVEGADRPAILAYNSWYTMQQRGETSADACNFNDFALLELHPDDAARAHPAMYSFGGPTGIASDEAAGDVIYTHGATSLRPDVEQLDARQGLIAQPGTWTHGTLQLTPGLPGDSGSPVVRADGEAIGILVTLQVAPLPLSNGITDLGQALAYANDQGGMDVELLTADLL
ncbi:MAG: trypsin-like peptidase domain-containing protein [Thermoplasmatota archaeon]